ncbi:MAG: CDP-alcohol phosphatidyltransferase family protein [Halorubrum sp.]
MTETSRSPPFGAVDRQFSLTVGGAAAVAGAALLTVGIGWEGKPTAVFLGGVVVVFLAATGVVRRSLRLARAAEGPQPITVATWVTIVRAGLVAAFAGFLFTEPPGGTAAWVPAVLFAAAALLDAVDGAIARRTDTVTEFGGVLDTEVDALLVAVGVVTVVVAGSAPVVFLAVGGARYAFVAGTAWRQRRGRPVFELEPSQFRRVTGAVIMSTVFLGLVPALDSALSRTVTWVVAVPVLAHFVWDWLSVSGRLGR